MRKGDKFNTGIGELVIFKLLGKGKSAYSYLAFQEQKPYVLKIMHNEPVSYYSWQGSKTEHEVKAYNQLIALAVAVPELVYFDIQQEYLVKEYIKGETAASVISKDGITRHIIKQLFHISLKLEPSYNIDYFPTNFVVSDQKLYYIDYEINQFDPKWSLNNWGIYYWANQEGFKEYLQTGSALKLNQNLETGEPFKEPFEEKVNGWINKYSKR